MNEIQIFACCAVGVAIAMDVITGFVNAVVRGEVASSKMREGFLHKFAIIMIMAVSIFLNYSAAYVNIGFEVPLVEAAAGYIVVMELASILENIRKMNPELSSNPLFKILESVNQNNE